MKKTNFVRFIMVACMFLGAVPFVSASEPDTESLFKKDPEIRFLQPNKSGSAVYEAAYTLKAIIKNVRKGKKIKLRQNDRTVPFFFNPQTGYLEADLTLREGNNQLTIIAKGRRASTLVIRAKKGAKPAEEEPEKPIVINKPKKDKPKKDKPKKDKPTKTKGLTAEQKVRTSIGSYSRKYIGIPYKYAGKVPKTGFDCSGFTHYVMKHFSVPLSPSSKAQAKEGAMVALNAVKPGDLIFFSNDGETITHVALVVSRRGEAINVIHSTSSKGVMVQDVNKSSYWKPKIMFARDILSLTK